MRSFGSDNHSGVHPDILRAIESANTDHTFAYGEDPWSERLQGLLSELFATEVVAYPVFNGTGANVLSLKTITRSFHAVVCAESAHINVDECGAPEFQSGCKLLPIATVDGKLTPELIRPHLHGFGFQHHSQPKVISISQVSELGTLYTVEEIRALADLAHAHDMYLHVDGARFANAVAALGVTPKEMITDTGVDVLSFGGTKNGMLLGEVVVFLRPELAQNACYERKQLMQLSSKMRFISAQFEAYLRGGLWIELASHANAMASRLAQEVATLPEVELTQKVEANGLFVKMPRRAIETLREEYFFYDWDENRNEVRWMCSFDTTQEDIAGFIDALRRAL